MVRNVDERNRNFWSLGFEDFGIPFKSGVVILRLWRKSWRRRWGC